MRLFSILSVGGGILVLSLLAPSEPRSAPVPDGGRYIGAAKCKNCHNGAAKGDIYDHWADAPHAQAYKTLATDKAKKIAKDLGIEDPQKSEKCLKCHTTAFGVDKKKIKRGFKFELGVQCESCHGPGEAHQKKRVREAMKKGVEPSPMDPGEQIVERSAAACKKCHNEESPTYREFCLKERMKPIEHLDPRKKRSKEELEKLRAKCEPDCKVCKPADKKGGDGK